VHRLEWMLRKYSEEAFSHLFVLGSENFKNQSKTPLAFLNAQCNETK